MNSLQLPTDFNNRKRLIIHADDAGLSHSENRATIEALNYGQVSSYSIMVPCQGFEEIGAFCKRESAI
ncbi:MAG: ChbG/HpnK family deacetylase [Flavobacteriaceae bacterium]|nr:ChbG/HpnK family deacetylase [Flavobacteriaceae bacterium]